MKNLFGFAIKTIIMFFYSSRNSGVAISLHRNYCKSTYNTHGDIIAKPYYLFNTERMRFSLGFFHGWQESRRTRISGAPLITPFCVITFFPYSEQVGWCLQYPYRWMLLSGPWSGESVAWYSPMSRTKPLRGASQMCRSTLRMEEGSCSLIVLFQPLLCLLQATFSSALRLLSQS